MPSSDQLGVAEDGVERRAQLVAHVGEELRLVLARLGELAALVLDFVEQPHVLDGDHRLVGEGGDQLDLLVRERRAPRRAQSRDADRHAFAQQRHAEQRAEAAQLLRLRSVCTPGRPSTSAIWTLRPSSSARPMTLPRPARAAWTSTRCHEFARRSRRLAS